MKALDTETDRGRVVLIATPTEALELWRYPLKEQWHVVMFWLRSLEKQFCCWNADYDIQAILKLIPRERNEWLWRESRVSWGPYKIRFVPGKFFAVSWGKKPLFKIYDLMQFFGMRLESAAQEILKEGKSEVGVDWKELLGTLKAGGVLARQIIDYCKRDALLVEKIYRFGEEAFQKAGVTFDKPVSCASIAAQKFRRASDHEVPHHINKCFEKCYRGGRIETTKRGYFGEAWITDLHSAYPAIMSGLVKSSGDWLEVEKYGPRPEAVYAAVLAKLAIPRGEYIYPLPVKGETQLMYPWGQWSQWLELDTYRILEERGWIVAVKRGWQLLNAKDNKPFWELSAMYDERLKTDSQELKWSLKKIMASFYGKTAQRIHRWIKTRIVDEGADFWKGEIWRNKEIWAKSTNFVYASAITSRTRKKLYLESAQQSGHVIFFATDGILSTVPLQKLDFGSGLGQWSEPEKVYDLVVVGSGVYTYRTTKGDTVTKFRGFEMGLDLYSLLDSNRRVLTLQVKRNYTLASAIIQKKYDLFNEIVEIPRYLDTGFDHKRIWDGGTPTGRKLLNANFDSRPWNYEEPVRLEE